MQATKYYDEIWILRGAHAYKPPFWLIGGHLQTIIPAVYMPCPPIAYQRDTWQTPDGDCIAVDSLPEPSNPNSPILILWHGLEGSSQSSYARRLMHTAQQQGWHGMVPHFRSCGGMRNQLARLYHAGDSQEVDWVIKRIHALHPKRPVIAVGVSLGGNALLKWLGQHPQDAARIVHAAVSISAPLDLCQAGPHLDQGLNRCLYTRFFLRTLKAKISDKMQQFDYPFTPQQLRACQTFTEFDNLVTAPLHGFNDVWDYWQQSSSLPYLSHITVPTLVLNARNDPFLPPAALPSTAQVAPCVQAVFPAQGGHVGFASSGEKGTDGWLEQLILHFMQAHAPLTRPQSSPR